MNLPLQRTVADADVKTNPETTAPDVFAVPDVSVA
jgi:hypothetical protein